MLNQGNVATASRGFEKRSCVHGSDCVGDVFDNCVRHGSVPSDLATGANH